MYLPRSLISKLYIHLQSTRHALSQPVLILVALEPDALCACRIITRLLKHDYIPHKIQPVAGYADLERAARELVQPMMESRGGSGGVVVCLGVGGMVDLGALLGLEPEGGAGGTDSDAAMYGGVEVWLLDSHRPWNLSNVFGGLPIEPARPAAGLSFRDRIPTGVSSGGKIERAYKPGKGGIVVFDDGDVEEDLAREQEAYAALSEMPDVDDDDDDDDDGEDIGETDPEDSEDGGEDEAADNEDDDRSTTPDPAASPRSGQKRKSWSDRDEDDSDADDDRPRQRRRSNSSSPIPNTPQRPRQRGLLSIQRRDDPFAFSSDPIYPEQERESSSGAVALAAATVAAPSAPSARALRRQLLRMRREKEDVLRRYYKMGASFSEPISSIAYSLAVELGRDDNDLLWMAIVGVTSMELYGRSSAGIAVPVRQADAGSKPTGWLGARGGHIRQGLRDEVRRLNPPDELGPGRVAAESVGVIPTTARSPEDTAIRLSPEPRFLLIRHWSLYDSMLHSPYLFSRLRTWSEPGLKRLHKLLAKMGVSLAQCKQSYAHMDMMLKRELRAKLLKYGSLYNLDDMVPSVDTDGKDRAGAKDGWGFVRSWGWRATLSAQDVGVVVGALLEVGKRAATAAAAADGWSTAEGGRGGGRGRDDGRAWRESRNGDRDFVDDGDEEEEEDEYRAQGQEWVSRFWEAYDALEDIDALKAGLPTAQFLHRAIYRTGTSLINKKHIKHLRAFRMCVVKEGPDVGLFNHPAALTKLALWVGEALSEQERDTTGKLSNGGRGTPLVVASLNEKRGVYVVVGTGGGGGPDAAYANREAAKRRKALREDRAKKKEDDRRNKERIREQKKQARQKNGDGDGEEEGLASEVDDDDDDDDETDSDSDSDSAPDDDDDDGDDTEAADKARGYGLNRFGSAFQEVVAETKARVRIDSFEHSVVEVKKEDLGAFLESLSMKAVVG